MGHVRDNTNRNGLILKSEILGGKRHNTTRQQLYNFTLCSQSAKKRKSTNNISISVSTTNL